MSGGLVFDSLALLPEAWRPLANAGPVRTFNPALLRDDVGWLLAYRVVAADGRRRIALCRLDEQLQIIAGSAVPFSDLVRFRPDNVYPQVAREWLADPRLYRWGQRLFIYWNSGWHEPRNHQFLQEIDPRTLAPLGTPRELLLRGERRPLEKNWTFFADHAGALHAIYSIAPHRVLRFTIEGEDDITLEDEVSADWSIEGYPPNHGGLRGGAPPVLHEGRFWSFCHSVHDGADGYRYAAAVYAFAAQPPFAPCVAPLRPLDLARNFPMRRSHPKLNPAVGEVIYPCGAAHDGARWLISHGINDELCAISFLADAAVRDAVRD